MKFLYIITLLSIFSCNNPDSKKVSFIKVYEGTIDKYPITMKLIVEDNNLKGNYIYNKFGEYFIIKGQIINDSIKIEGYDKKNNLTDIFLGTLQNGKVSGDWSKPNGENKMKFSIIESSIPFPSEIIKQDLPTKENKLINVLWYTNNNDAYVPSWIVFSKNGEYKEWTNDDGEPKQYSGTWKMIDNGKRIELTTYEYSERMQFQIINIKEKSFEIIANGPSAGSKIYEKKGLTLDYE